MEFAIVDEDNDVVFASTQRMRLLCTYVCYHLMEGTYDDEVGDYTHIYDAYDDDETFFAKIKTEKLIEMMNQWEEISKKKPKQVFIKKEGENFIFDCSKYESKEMSKLDLTNLNFTKNNIFNLPKETFNGGFHYIPKEKNKSFEIKNKFCDEYGVITGDIKFQKDFTVNHSFFPENWTIDEIKEQIIKSINKSLTEKYVEIEDEIFSFYGYSDGAITIQTIVNNKGEILTAYPIPWRMK